MKQKQRKSNLVHHNEFSGTYKIQELKSLIKEALYSEYPENFSSGSMMLASRVISTHDKYNTLSETIDLMLFYVECGTQFTCDYGDIDEDFYEALEVTFEDLLKLIKQGGNETLYAYKDRLLAIMLAAQEIGWGYPDQLADLVSHEFPELLKK